MIDIILGTHVSEITVATLTIIKQFNVVKDIALGIIPGTLDSTPNPLLFQTAEKRFCNCIIITVAPSAHTRI
jgi:hypothetical protein